MSTLTVPIYVSHESRDRAGVGLLDAPSLADTIYRRFFIGGIVTILTAGASWGAFILWQIGFAGKFTGVPLQQVNAHGQAQIYGWVGLFVMGFAYQSLPRLWVTELAWPQASVATFALMIAGLVLRTIGMTPGDAWSGAAPVALAGGLAQLAAAAIFASQIVVTFRRSTARLEPWSAFVLTALLWFVAMSALDTWHTHRTMVAVSRDALLWQVATYQAPLRDLQVHGMALFMILGISQRMLPAWFGVAATPRRRAWLSWALLTTAVVLEVTIFVVYRFSGKHAVAALLLVPWVLLAVGVATVVLPWKLWRALPVKNRSGKFLRAAYAWLAISLTMLLLLPVYQAFSGIPFSHAFYGAIRHAITVGFISLMIMGMAAHLVPTLCFRGRPQELPLPSLWVPFGLVNAGCFLRVSLQTLTDWHPVFFALVGVSGILEVVGLGIWGFGLVRILHRSADIGPSAHLMAR